MALTRDQKKSLLIGGGVGTLALVVGYFAGSRKAHAMPSLEGRREERHEKRKKHREDRDENDRGEYGRKKKHKRKHHKHHTGAESAVGQRPQYPIISPTERGEEGPGAPIWRLNARIHGFVSWLGPTMTADASLWTSLRPTWEREILPFLGEWEPFWRDSNRWTWSEFDRWATRWNEQRARVLKLLPPATAQGAPL